MLEITKYKCSFCGQEHENKEWMNVHEECCALNPKNQPCATCEHQILGMGCEMNVNMEAVGGNVICFCYKKGYPKNPLGALKLFDAISNNNSSEDNKNDE